MSRNLSLATSMRRLAPRPHSLLWLGLLSAAVASAPHAARAQGTAPSATSFTFQIFNTTTNQFEPLTSNTAPFGSKIYQAFSVTPGPGGTGVPTGTVAITADSVPYDGGSVTLDNTGSAVDRNFNPAVQNHPYRLTATYSGDATFASSSFTDHFSITAAVPTITLTTSVPTLSGTGSVTLTAVVEHPLFL